MAHKNRLPEIAAERGEPIDSLLPRLLNALGSDEAVAAEIGVHKNTVLRWRRLNKFVRKPSVTFVQEPEHA